MSSQTSSSLLLYSSLALTDLILCFQTLSVTCGLMLSEGSFTKNEKNNGIFHSMVNVGKMEKFENEVKINLKKIFFGRPEPKKVN